MREANNPLRIPPGRNEAIDYLLTEVLAHLPTSTQGFLVETSILDRLNTSLCVAVTERDDVEGGGQKLLEWLEQKSIFTVALDDSGEWFRYHHLFGELLRSQLERGHTQEEIRALHSRASSWYAANGFVEEAIRHALAAGDMLTAAQLVEANRLSAAIYRDNALLARWLGMLPRVLIEERPELLLLETWLLDRSSRYVDVAATLDRIERLIELNPLPEPQQTWILGEVDMHRARLQDSTKSGAEIARALSERALERTPMSRLPVRTMARATLVTALQALGDHRNMNQVLDDGLRECTHHDSVDRVYLMIKFCHVSYVAGDVFAQKRYGAKTLQLAIAADAPFAVVFAHWFIADVAYQCNDLAKAKEHFAAALRFRHSSTSPTLCRNALDLALVHFAQGKDEEAQALLDMVNAHGWDTHSDRVLLAAAAYQAHMALRLGKSAEARWWANECVRPVPMPPAGQFRDVNPFLVAILIDQATPESLAEAANLLEYIERDINAPYTARFLMEALALRALLHAASGDEPAALAVLKHSVALAEPGGLLRVYLDLGQPMADLMQRWAQKERVPDLVEKVLVAFSDERVSPFRSAGHIAPPSPPAMRFDERLGVIEALSRREVEILTLLGQDLTAYEIARQLSLSVYTVKRHRANIYQKLNVNRRRDALAIARSAGLINAPPQSV